MSSFTDQLGYSVELAARPRRIVSLVPSQTELLFDLGLNETVVGITRYCVHPQPKIRNKTRVGGTKNPDLDLIRELRPDLIIGNREENRREDMEILKAEFPVWISDVDSLPAATAMIRELGRLVENETSAHWMANLIEERFGAVATEAAGTDQPQKVAYLIWRKPWMVAGGGTFIDAMLGAAGFTNAFADLPRYPECTGNELKAASPEVIFLSSEPYPFREHHLTEMRALFPSAPIKLVDGELFSWYGSRLLRTPAYLRSLRTALADC